MVSAPSLSTMPGQEMRVSTQIPLAKEVCLTGGHINFTFTSIKESPEECGTSFNDPSKQAIWFVDEASSDVKHTFFN